MLVFNPEKRPSAEICLKHSYVARFHSKKDNLDVGYNVIPPINDDIQLTVDEYRQRLYAMIQVKFRYLRTEKPDRQKFDLLIRFNRKEKKLKRKKDYEKIWKKRLVTTRYSSLL